MSRQLAHLILPMAIVAIAAPAAFGQAFEMAAKKEFETNSKFSPPPTWPGPKFELSRDYPATPPPPDPSLPWMQPGSDFRVPAESAEYLNRVLAYCFEGNIAVDFKVQDNAVRKWHHTPWMHSHPAKGREPIRGLTQERPAPIGYLHASQARRVQSWAVGFYNEPGGWVVGRVWADPAHPNSATMPRFPVGTVVFKLLFTNASDVEVPYLQDSVTWKAMINKTGPAPNFNILASRETDPVDVRLLQIDIAVRDSRADPETGWVFGTFVYNFAMKTPGDTNWQRMMPVGLMWGNDPAFSPSSGTRPGEGWLNPDALTLLVTPKRVADGFELGHQGRVNGPVDNPRSSCLSCHSTAQDKPAPILFNRRTSSSDTYYHTRPESDWFRNLGPSEPFKPGEKSLDYSLQLADGLESFEFWKAANFPSPPPPAPPGAPQALRAATPKKMIDRGDDDEDIAAGPIVVGQMQCCPPPTCIAPRRTLLPRLRNRFGWRGR